MCLPNRNSFYNKRNQFLFLTSIRYEFDHFSSSSLLFALSRSVSPNFDRQRSFFPRYFIFNIAGNIIVVASMTKNTLLHVIIRSHDCRRYFNSHCTSEKHCLIRFLSMKFNDEKHSSEFENHVALKQKKVVRFASISSKQMKQKHKNYFEISLPSSLLVQYPFIFAKSKPFHLSLCIISTKHII